MLLPAPEGVDDVSNLYRLKGDRLETTGAQIRLGAVEANEFDFVHRVTSRRD